MNIYSLYVTRSRYERNYFNYLLKNINFKNVVIVHLDFHYLDHVDNLKINTKNINYTLYQNGNVVSGILKTFDQLVGIFPRFNNGLDNFFMYSGHSNGMYLMNKNIKLLRIDDFCELAYRVVGKKIDVLGFDCCLCGNINCLSTCYNYTKYIVAASGYWAELSMLQTKSIYHYQGDKDIKNYLKNIVTEMINIESVSGDFITNYSIYEMNNSLLQLIRLTLNYKDSFTKKKNVIIENYYYKDLECAFKEIGIDIKKLLEAFVLFCRFKTNKCYTVKKKKSASKSYPSNLSIITKRPINCGLPTYGDIFLS